MAKWLVFLALGCFSALLQAEEPADEETEATEQQEEAPRPVLRSRHQLELQRLQQGWPKQFRTLDSEHDQAGALYLPANSSEARGWVILLPGSGQPADTASNIDRLRHVLPDSGWHTLSLQLPATDFVGLHVSPPPVQQITDPEDLQAEGDETGNTAETIIATDTPDAETEELSGDETLVATDAGDEQATTAQPEYSRRILALIDAAVAMARAEQPQQLVLLGQQEGAHWAMLWADKQQPEAHDEVLVLLEPRENAEQPEFEELLGRTRLQVADFHFAHDQGSKSAAQQRQNSSKRNPDSQYHQVRLREPAQALREDELVRRVKGWLITLDAK